MSQLSFSVVISALLASCGGKADTKPTIDSFCTFVTDGKLRAATEVAHAALMTGPRGPSLQGGGTLPNTTDESGRLGLWLEHQDCIAKVTIPTTLIETEPPIREIAFILRPDAAGTIRTCVIALKLAPDSPLAIHPRDLTTADPNDQRCTPIPEMPPTVGHILPLVTPFPIEPPPPPPQSAEAWAWARAIAPELDTLVPDIAAKPADAAWWKDGARRTLFAPKDWLATGTAKTCVPITVTATDGVLHAMVTQDGVDAPKYGCRKELLLGATAELADGGCPDRSGGVGSLTSEDDDLGHNLAIDDDGSLAYDDVPITIVPSCRWITVERAGCAEKMCRACQITLRPSANTSAGFGFLAAPDPAPVLAQGSCEPCPIDHQAAAVPRLAASLRGRVFQKRTGGGVRFSPTKAACESRAAR
jgi:hypothetical protein